MSRRFLNRSQVTSASAALLYSRRGVSKPSTDAAAPPLPPLRCPGGPRVKAEGLKQLFKVPHAGYLAKYGQRFILNLKLTHQVAALLSRTTLRTPDKLLLELGPGAGALTRSLLTRPCVGVLGIEQDERFNGHLEQIRQYTGGKFQWTNGDVLRINELEIVESLYAGFAQQHRRKPAADARERASSDGNKSDGGEACSSGTKDSGCCTDDFYCEDAPLRNVQREKILRKRFGKYAAFNHDTASGQNSGSAAPSSDVSGCAFSSESAAFEVSDRWWSDGDAKLEVIANLPFNIITELLMRYAVDCSRKQNLFVFGRVPLHVFTQQEVAECIIAPAGSIHFSRLSVLCQCFFHTQLLRTFREMTYYPKTAVLGALITLQPRAVPLLPGLDAATLIHFTDLLMRPGQRGMTVYKALQQHVPPEVAQYMLQELRTDGALTVLDLTTEEVCKLATLWHRFLEASSQQAHGSGT
ncbi:rRNA dimethyltransferase, putative [Trypanosoma equiperdum]|uniref:rRNA adenine N(6)-methyltransferase n=1 Tax=Trypanosoma equiperdum TaxID=5694 RepID=A0A1G4IFC3_TRYEQ|nr:rRNA dimethyltransferase, putative [Trypanosoma equiperdum]